MTAFIIAMTKYENFSGESLSAEEAFAGWFQEHRVNRSEIKFGGDGHGGVFPVSRYPDSTFISGFPSVDHSSDCTTRPCPALHSSPQGFYRGSWETGTACLMV